MCTAPPSTGITFFPTTVTAAMALVCSTVSLCAGWPLGMATASCQATLCPGLRRISAFGWSYRDSQELDWDDWIPDPPAGSSPQTPSSGLYGADCTPMPEGMFMVQAPSSSEAGRCPRLLTEMHELSTRGSSRLSNTTMKKFGRRACSGAGRIDPPIIRESL